MIPQFYQMVNIYESKDSPALAHVSDTTLAWFFKRYFIQDVLSIFEFEGMPEEWNKDYFLYTLCMFGRIAVIKTNVYGVIPQYCTLSGYDIYRAPSKVLVTNPLFSKSIEARIGEDAALIKMQPDYGGAWDLVEYYASATALASEALAVNLLNSKLAYVFAAENKAVAESFKKLYDKIASGEPAAVVKDKLFDEDGRLRMEIFNQNLKNTFIAAEIQGTIQQFRAEFHTKIGIPNVNIAKASGVGAAEVNANNLEATSLAELWRETIQKGLDMVRELYGINIKVKLRFTGGGVENAESFDPFDNGAL